MQSLIDQTWSEVHFYHTNKFFRLFYPIMLFGILQTLRGIECLYLGYPFKIRAHIANTIKAKKNVILDDGSASIVIANQLNDSEFLRKKLPSWYDILLRRSISLEYTKNAFFFTAYNEINWPNNKTIFNGYSALKKKIKAEEKNLDILFIGSPIGKELVSKEKERDLILAMIQFYSHKKVLYAVHRFEDLLYLQNEFKDMSLNFIRFDTAIEVALLQKGLYPRVVSSFCSSALVTLSTLYNCHAEALVIPHDCMSVEHAKNLDIVYQNYKNKGIHLKYLSESHGVGSKPAYNSLTQ
ncbi:hypothetical protein AZK46_00235 [Acinetobacter baumannii]|nr:hypothetical protein AZK46_00235 [Acinetobacter baumannii]